MAASARRRKVLVAERIGLLRAVRRSETRMAFLADFVLANEDLLPTRTMK
jgi:hypothetical protein